MRRLHPLTAVVRAGSIGLGLAFAGSMVLPLIAGEVSLGLLGLGGPLGFAIGAAYGYVSYRRFTYELTDDTFDLAKGVIARTEREIPLQRVQNVDVERSIFGQLFGLAVVRIETAGGGSTEATLSYVDAAEADRLQQGIRSRRAALARDAGDAGESDGDATDTDTTEVDSTPERSTPSTTEPDEEGGESSRSATGGPQAGAGAGSGGEPGDRTDSAASTSADEAGEWASPTRTPGTEPDAAEWGSFEAESTTTLVTLRTRELALLALTNFQVGSILFLIVGTPFLGQFAVDVLLAAAEPFGGPTSLDPSRMTPDQYFLLGGVAGPLVAIAGYVVSAVVAVTEYYDFELARRGDDLVYERGLLRRYSGSIPTDKIQTLTVTETAPMRWIGYAALGVETAGYAGGRAESGSQAAIPLARRERVLELGGELFPFDPPDMERPPKRARTRYAARYSIALAVVTAIAYIAAQVVPAFTLWWVPLLLAPLVPVAAHLKWRHLGYALADDHVFVRSGFWRRQTHVVPYYRLQTVVGEATIFQRRRHLASLVADTASSATLTGSAPTAHDLDADTVRELRGELRERLQEHLTEHEQSS
jgi:putative membrane protein